MNWHPPPGETTQALQPISAAYSKSDFAVGKTGREGLHLGRVFGLLGQERDAPGHQYPGEVFGSSQRHHHRRKPLVAGGHCRLTPRQFGSERMVEAKDDRGIIAVGQAVSSMPRVPLLRPSQGSAAMGYQGNAPRQRRSARAAASTSRPTSQ